MKKKGKDKCILVKGVPHLLYNYILGIGNLWLDLSKLFLLQVEQRWVIKKKNNSIFSFHLLFVLQIRIKSAIISVQTFSSWGAVNGRWTETEYYDDTSS